MKGMVGRGHLLWVGPGSCQQRAARDIIPHATWTNVELSKEEDWWVAVLTWRWANYGTPAWSDISAW